MPRVRSVRRGTGLPCPLHALRMPSTLPAPQYVQLLGSPQTSSVRVFYGGLVALGVKNLPASAGDIRDVGSIPGLGRSPGGENGNPLQFAWEIPWTEEPGRLQSTELQRIRHNESNLALHWKEGLNHWPLVNQNKLTSSLVSGGGPQSSNPLITRLIILAYNDTYHFLHPKDLEGGVCQETPAETRYIFLLYLSDGKERGICKLHVFKLFTN